MWIFTQDWGNEKLQRAQKTVESSPYDLEAWSILIREAQNRPINEVRPVFEKLVTVFPSAGRYWKIYIEQEVSLGLTDVFLIDTYHFIFVCSLEFHCRAI